LTSSLTDLELRVCARGKCTFLNRSNRRSTVQWYFPLMCSLFKVMIDKRFFDYSTVEQAGSNA